MSKRTVIQLQDDLDGSLGDDVTTVTFSLDGAGYEIELHDAHRQQLRDALQPYIEHGRPVPAKRRRSRSK